MIEDIKVPFGHERRRLGDLLPPDAFPEIDRLAKAGAPVSEFLDLCNKYQERLSETQTDPNYLAWTLYGLLSGAKR